MFVRFVVGTEAENAFWLTGVFTIAREMRDRGELYDSGARWLGERFDWLNTHLPCPPFREKRRSDEWTEEAVSWFRDDQLKTEVLGLLDDLVHVRGPATRRGTARVGIIGVERLGVKVNGVKPPGP